MTLITSNIHKVLIKQLEENPTPKRVDVIMSYIRKEGLDAVLPIFERLAQQGTKVRIITTLQRKITDLQSLDNLAKLENTSVYIFWLPQLTFHSKGWLFLYEEDKRLDTVIIGSSNITRNGMRVAVDWNVLLHRKSPRSDASRIIDDFDSTFSKYIESPIFRRCLWKYDVKRPDYQILKETLALDLLTDDELIETWASPKVQERWKELKAEQDEIRTHIRAEVAPTALRVSWEEALQIVRKDEMLNINRTVESWEDGLKELHKHMSLSDIDRSMMEQVEQAQAALALKAQETDENRAELAKVSSQLAAPYYENSEHEDSEPEIELLEILPLDNIGVRIPPGEISEVNIN